MSRPSALIVLLSSLTLVALCADVRAEFGTTIQGGHSGNWFNVNEPGHGVFAEVSDDETSPTGKRMVVGWFAFFNGQQVWIFATGHVLQDTDGQVAVMQAWIFEGNEFPPRYLPELTRQIPWGEIRLFFLGCDFATLQWTSLVDGFGAGEIALQRLTSISGAECDPDLGINPLDDHGENWETATSITFQPNVTTELLGVLDSRNDIDAFLFVLRQRRTVKLWTLGESDTTGRLHRLTSFEDPIAFDDDGGIFRNFLIERELPAGTYTVHVGGTLKGAYGEYQLYFHAASD